MAVADLRLQDVKTPRGFALPRIARAHRWNGRCDTDLAAQTGQLELQEEAQEGAEDVWMFRACAPAQVTLKPSHTRLLFHFPC